MSDNIYSAFFTRFSIDTLYFGLVCDSFEFVGICEKIKNYLFFKHELVENLTSSRSRFYRMEITCPEHGFFMFFSPRSKLKNNYCTIQLGGKFFKDIDFSSYFLAMIFENYYDRINFQRVDVALDVCFKDVVVWDTDVTHNWGFPFPDYRKDWKNRRIPFNLFGRYLNNVYFINAVSQGHDDLVLRVYDKTLELQEKYHQSYSDYYQLKENFIKVFRIEYQMRSDKLKDFVLECEDNNIVWDNVDNIIDSVMSYVFKKYDFVGLEFESFYDFRVKTCCPNQKHKSTIEGRIEHARKMQNYYYNQHCDLVQEKKNIDDSKKYLKEIIISEKTDEFNKLYEPLESVFDFDKTLKVKMDLYDTLSECELLGA